LSKQKRKINVADITNDILLGMTDAELMDKYRLSVKGLQSIFNKLEQIGTISSSQIYGRISGYADTVAVEQIWEGSRQHLEVLLPIHQAGRQEIQGLVQDISSKGVGIKGIDSSVGEVKTFVINPGTLFPINQFDFEAVCRWVKSETADGDPIAGFEIVSISPESLENLRQLIVSSSGVCMVLD
jgi:hypothetical protein